jgi:hypothetical protein
MVDPSFDIRQRNRRHERERGLTARMRQRSRTHHQTEEKLTKHRATFSAESG